MKQYLSRSLWLALWAGAVMLAPSVQAQDAARIGFVNTDRMLREAAPAKAAQTKLEQEFSRREKELDDAGLAAGQHLGEPGVDEEAQLGRLRAFQRRQPGDEAIGIAKQFAAQGLDDGSGSQCHVACLRTVRCRAGCPAAALTCRRSAP